MQKHFKAVGEFLHITDLTQKTKYKSLFLDKYDNHFTAAQHNFIIYNLNRLLQNFSPDIVSAQPVNMIYHYNSVVNQYRQEDSIPLDWTLGSLKQTPTSKLDILRIMCGLRYRKQLSSGTDNVVAPYRIYGNGYLLAGRFTLNIARRLRWGSQMRASYFTYNYGLKSGNNPFTGLVRLQDSKATYAELRSAGAFLLGAGIRYNFTPAQHRKVTVSLLTAVNSLRTVWYSTNRFLLRFKSNIGCNVKREYFMDSERYFDDEAADMHQMLRQSMGMFDSELNVSGTKGDWHLHGVDHPVYEYFRHRPFLRHHNRRIVTGRYERKLWNYKKTRQYWRYMRWVSRFFFRGLAYLRFFTMRIDVFLVNHLRVRNIAFSRILVNGGHAFIGEKVCKNPAQFVVTMNVVSVSREVRRWLTYMYGSSGVKRRIARRRATGLAFARASNMGYLRDHQNRYVVPYGDYVDVLNAADGFRSRHNWSSFSYFQGQRVVASAWW